MDKNKELYYESAYIREFDAVVVSCEPGAGSQGGFEVVLDVTAFFPEQGGQTSDIGYIEFGDGEKVEVTHVSITACNSGNITEAINLEKCCESTGEKSGMANGAPQQVIKHITDREIPVGTKVHGVIDWNHRFSNMQQHTGEHIFSGLVNARFGYDNVGFHLSDTEVTMDYNGVLTQEDIKALEMAANQAIWENIEVQCKFPDPEELKTIPYRSKKELTGDVRIVTIEGYDSCACCAPHVERTGEIGVLKVVGLQNYKGGVRVNILCGKRALEYIDAEHAIVSELAGMLTTSSDKVITSVKRAFEDNSALKAELNAAREQLMEFEIAGIDKALTNVYLVKDASFDMNLMRKMVNSLAKEHAGFCGMFAGDDALGYKYIVAAGTDGGDCRQVSQLLKDSFGAKGGGQPAMVQGSLGSAAIAEVIKALENIK